MNICFEIAWQILCLFFFLAMPHDMWDLSSVTRDQMCTLCLGGHGVLTLDHKGSPFLMSILPN